MALRPNEGWRFASHALTLFFATPVPGRAARRKKICENKGATRASLPKRHAVYGLISLGVTE
jgi:hypothetical protein